MENVLGLPFGDTLRGSDMAKVIDPNISGATVAEVVDGGGGTDTLRVDYLSWDADVDVRLVGGLGSSSAGLFTHDNGISGTLDAATFTII